MQVRSLAVAASLGLGALLLTPENAWTQDDAIRQLAGEDFDKAENAGDVSAKMRLYAADAVLLPPGGAPPVIGQQAIRAWQEANFKKETTQGVSTVDEVQVFGEWGFARGTYSGVVTSKAGGEPQKSSGYFLVIVRRQRDGTWKIARDIWNDEPHPKKTH